MIYYASFALGDEELPGVRHRIELQWNDASGPSGQVRLPYDDRAPHADELWLYAGRSDSSPLWRLAL